MFLLKRTKAIAAIMLIAVVGLLFYIRSIRVIPILMYHSISSEKESSLHVSLSNFEKQIKYLNDKKYNVITVDELIRYIKAGKRYLPKTVVITFDDGFEDNFIYGFPILNRYKMPAAIFLITSYAGEKEGYLQWDQIKVMHENGITFGGHTRNNVYLADLSSRDVLVDEIYGAKLDIEGQISDKVNYFCYPTGGFNDRVKSVVKDAGYVAAFTTNRGFDKLNIDLYELNRIKITNSDMTKPFHFRAKLSGFYNIFRRAKPGG